MDKDNLVQVVFDKDVLFEEWYGCSDGTTFIDVYYNTLFNIIFKEIILKGRE
ncbi:hypothetical protein [Clostridium tagluense]|uniref:hypothetical protein n=1 Tax=Clostridium tagluense TaxID=360422 RepID=UPI0021632A53|nr:hypothetical protein [Clostridium tagluense]